jgi:hypothetical protein
MYIRLPRSQSTRVWRRLRSHAPGGIANYLNRARPADEATNRRWRAAVIY